MDPKAFFQELAVEAKEHEKELAGVNATLKFDIVGDGIWRLVINGPDVQIEQGDGNAACTFSISEEDFQRVSDGTLKPMVAIMERRLKVEGNISLALKLSKLL